MARAKFKLTTEKALKRINTSKQVTIADVTGEIIKNVRVGNISYMDDKGNPFTFGKGGAPKVLVNLMLMSDYGYEQALEHIANGDTNLATEQNMVASVSPEIANQLDPYMSKVNILLDAYINADGITCLGIDSLSIPHSQKETKKADFTSAFEGLIDEVVTSKTVTETAIKDITVTKSKKYDFPSAFEGLIDAVTKTATVKTVAETAIKDYTKAIEIDPSNDEIYNNRGLSFCDLKDWENAIKDFTSAIEINPNNDEYYSNRGLSFCDLKDWENAIKDFTSAIEINPKNDDNYGNRGWYFNNLEDWENAIKDFTSAIEINPKNDEYYSNRGLSFYKLEDWNNTIKNYSKAIEINPNNDEYYSNRGWSFYKLKDWENAIKDYTKVIKINPTEKNFHMLGHSHQKLGCFQKGITNFKIAIILNPETGWHQNCLGDLYLEIKNHNLAKKHYKNAIKLNPNDDDYKKSFNNLLSEINSENFNKYSFKEDYLIKVDYKSTIKENSTSYPILKSPEHGCIIKTHNYGRNMRRGYKEKEFQNLIERYFSDEYEISGNTVLSTGEHSNPYEPDIAIIGIYNNVRIDIEIDEPYAGISRIATHCINDDDNRDNYFTDRGWIVIRFSEYQVHKNEKECLKYIASIINSIDKNFTISSIFSNTNTIQIDELWDINIAERMEEKKYREEYLNHEFTHQNIEVNGSIKLTKNEKQREIIEENLVKKSTIYEENLANRTINMGITNYSPYKPIYKNSFKTNNLKSKQSTKNIENEDEQSFLGKVFSFIIISIIILFLFALLGC